METNEYRFLNGSGGPGIPSVHIPWRSVAVLLYFLLMADAKERELFSLKKLPNPTGVRFLLYLLWLAVSVLVSDNLSDRPPLYDLGLLFVALSWTCLWALHMSQTAVLLAVFSLCTAGVDTVAFPRPELLIWCLFVLFHVCTVARFHYLRQSVPIPERPISRFSGPDGDLANAVYIVSAAEPMLVSQKADP